MKARAVIVIAWWFFWAGWASSSVVGPFRDQNECGRVRGESVPQKGYVVWKSDCWWDGKS